MAGESTSLVGLVMLAHRCHVLQKYQLSRQPAWRFFSLFQEEKHLGTTINLVRLQAFFDGCTEEVIDEFENIVA